MTHPTAHKLRLLRIRNQGQCSRHIDHSNNNMKKKNIDKSETT